MPFLGKAIDPSEVQHHLRAYFSSLKSENGQISLEAIQVKRYKPQRRCLIEYDLKMERSGFPSKEITLVGKARGKKPDKSTYKILKSLHNKGFGADSQDKIYVPKPIGIISEFNMLLQQKVSGDSATKLITEEGGVALARRIAESAYKLHQTRIPVRRRHTIQDELNILHERLSIVAKMKSDWRKRLKILLDACDLLGATIPESELCGIHRDFYPDQIIVDGPKLYIVDFDLYCEGDPGLDIGNFLGHLKEQSLRIFNDPDAMADREEALEERFVDLCGEHIRASIRAYITLTLVRHIYLSTQFSDRRQFTETLLELCEQRLRVV